MIIPDTSILLYAYNSTSQFHGLACAWVEETFSGSEQIGLPWIVIVGFIRIGADARVHSQPWTMAEAVAIVDAWLTRPNIFAMTPGRRHWEILRSLLAKGQVRGPLTTDAHIAAHALETGALLATTIETSPASKVCVGVSPLDA